MRVLGLCFGLLTAAIAGPTLAQTAVYFAEGEATADVRATDAVGLAAELFAVSGAGTVVVTGHTATVGDADENVVLSQRRAQVVRDMLISVGIPASLITVEAYGETRPAILTEDNTPEAYNDRVEINFGASSGW